MVKRQRNSDLGNCCVRFGTLEDLPLDLIGQAVARTPVADFIEQYETARKSK